jgi:ribonuclease BN (tRNA processing enzyme)
MYQMLNIPLEAEQHHTWHYLLKFPLYARKEWVKKNLPIVLSVIKNLLSDRIIMHKVMHDSHKTPWDTIGFICINDNMYKEAEEIYDIVFKKLTDLKEDTTIALYNRGISRFLQGRYGDAYEDFKLATKNEHHGFNKDSLSYGALKYMDEVLFPTREMIKRNHERLIRDLNMPRMAHEVIGPNKLKIFRKWNSSTPLFSQNASQGGGYYLTLKNAHKETKGIVIDPGYNFLDIFRDHRLGILDIDAIIITHDHDDHSEALEGILSLVAKYNDHKNSGPSKVIDVFGSPGVMLKYQGLFNKTDKEGNNEINFKLMIPGNRITEINGAQLMDKHGFELMVNQAYHPELWTNQESTVGVTIETNLSFKHHQLKLGITADTRYEPYIGNQYQDVQVMLINIGSIEKEEGKMLKSHLGVFGCVNLLKEARIGKQLLSILTEFGEEFRGRRKIISKIIELWGQPMEPNLVNPEFRVIPADLNLEVNLADLSLKDTKTNRFHYYSEMDFDEIDADTMVYKHKTNPVTP